jgi:radical SAM protein with 4Fe4S-binding SPASM domain
MLLDKAISQDPQFFQELDFLFVSIDGTKEQHNRFRKGTSLERIEKNLQILKETSQTNVLMGSTLREGIDEFLKLYLAKLCDFFFWHLIELDNPIDDLQTFRRLYQEDLRHLLENFVNALFKGEILPFLPLLELIYFSLKGIRRGQTGCGVEKLRNFDILSGKVLPCVDMGEELIIADFTNGDLKKTAEDELKKKLRHIVSYRDWLGCKACIAEFFCGGRCSILIKISPERAKQYCLLTQDFVFITKEFLPLVKEALFTNNLPEESLYYPYGWLNLLTDVVP